MPMRVAVVGAGPAGLASARHLTTRGDKYTCVVFEQTGSIGGTWVYTDRVGTDEFGLPIHTSMYKCLKTNLPTEVMCYPDFPLVAEEEYIPSEQVLQYLKEYEQKYQLEPHIRFYHHVTHVKPKDKLWEVTVVNLKTKEKQTHEFDAVMLCHGHYSKPHIPKAPETSRFQGELMHSHDYRTPAKFRGKRVVVIGAGFSARDIALDISTTAAQVIVSHHMNGPLTNITFRENTIQKPDIKSVGEKTVVFQDDSSFEVDTILYCTGYLQDFPFLDKSCSFDVDNNFVQPLYKHMFHIRHPTLCVICLPIYVSPLGMGDLQVRFFLKTLDGSVKLPSAEEMIADTERDLEWRRAEPGFSNRKAHKMAARQEVYCNEIADIAQEPRLSPVVFKRFNESVCGANLLK